MLFFGARDIVVLCFCAWLHYIYRHRQRRLLPYPPSLPGWPLVGNAFQLPLTYMHLFYQGLGRKLKSKIIYVEALGQPIVVVNDARIASDLLDKRSAIYSSRPPSPMLVDVIGSKQFFVLLPYGDEWRNHRRIFQQHFSTKKLPREKEKILHFIHKALLPNLYQRPEEYRAHVQQFVGGISLSMTYGVPVQRNDDPLLHLSDEAFKNAVVAGSPGKYLVNVVPVLKYVPDWFPGAHFKKEAREIRKQLARILEEPYQMTRNLMTDESGQECFVSACLESHKGRPDYEMHEHYIKQAASNVFGAVAETTIAGVLTFILAMLLHPEVQCKAQQEIDGAVGFDRLPDFSDQLQLPYLSAIVKEVLRWNPITPLGIAHQTTVDDVYEGYFIPKGSTIMANVYAMLHDGETFPNPKSFDPERFIKNGVPVEDILDPTVVGTFGFGRRKCPGSHIALAALYITAASILSLFDISPALDESNNPIVVKPEFIAASLVSEPLSFPCRFIPRKGKDIEALLAGNMHIDVL